MRFDALLRHIPPPLAHTSLIPAHGTRRPLSPASLRLTVHGAAPFSLHAPPSLMLRLFLPPPLLALLRTLSAAQRPFARRMCAISLSLRTQPVPRRPSPTHASADATVTRAGPHVCSGPRTCSQRRHGLSLSLRTQPVPRRPFPPVIPSCIRRCAHVAPRVRRAPLAGNANARVGVKAREGIPRLGIELLWPAHRRSEGDRLLDWRQTNWRTGTLRSYGLRLRNEPTAAVLSTARTAQGDAEAESHNHSNDDSHGDAASPAFALTLLTSCVDVTTGPEPRRRAGISRESTAMAMGRHLFVIKVHLVNIVRVWCEAGARAQNSEEREESKARHPLLPKRLTHAGNSTVRKVWGNSQRHAGARARA